MKKFNVVEDQMLNEFAVEFAGGNEEAGNQFFEIVFPKLVSYAERKYSHLDSEDLAQEFMIEAVKGAREYAERYQDKGNVMGLIYTKCEQRLVDLGRANIADKRSESVVVGYDENGEEIRENRVVSLNSPVGEEGDSEFGDSIALEQLSVEKQFEQNENKTVLEKVVEELISSTKGRNAQLIPLIVEAKLNDWDNADLQDAIAEIISKDGKRPANATIRKAQQRALDAMEKAIRDGKIPSASQLVWDF